MPRRQPARKSDARSASALARASGLAPGMRQSFPKVMIAEGPTNALIFDLCAVNNTGERLPASPLLVARRDSDPNRKRYF
jgi:hypothetical protein